MIQPGPPEGKSEEVLSSTTMEEIQSDQDYEEVLEDTKEECAQFGALKSVIIPRTGAGVTKIFLEYPS